MTPVPDFPDELVEAAAKAAMEAEPGQNWECATAKEADVYLRDSLAVLAAVVPLIEQRVIDRLAREAAGGPVPDDHPGVLASLGPLCTLTMDTSERERVKMAQIVIHAARPYLAACGVAAERARCPLCNHEWRRHDPEDGRCDCHSETILGACQCGRDLPWMQERIAAMSLAALVSSQPATEPVTASESMTEGEAS